MAPRDVHALVPGACCDYVIFHGRWDLAGMINGKDLECRGHPGGPCLITGVPQSGAQAVFRVKHAIMEERSERCYTAGFEDEARGRESRSMGTSRSWKREEPPEKADFSSVRHLAPMTVR